MNQDNHQRHWRIESRRTVYRGFYQIDEINFNHQRFDGASSGSVNRELFVRGNVVGLLPYDPATDSVALIEQFRIGAMNQQPDPWLTEIIAGMIDTDESPAEVAIREAYEEAGISLDSVELISHYLASPGASTEEVFVFYAETDLSGVSGLHGLADEDEDIQVGIYPAEQVFSMLKSRQIKNALSIVAVQWLKLKRAGLS
ncbi:MAG: NUDIX domain-containing protein [Granulosicoccus sp.]|nr:NUDIX domain-containing protein [Granulosicoccus sp.]